MASDSIKRWVKRALWRRSFLFGAPMAAICLFCGDWKSQGAPWTLAWLAAGWFTWTFLEYIFHRFLEHRTPQSCALRDWHGHHFHHRHPDDIRYAIVAWYDALGMVLLAAVLQFLLFWNLDATIFFLAGLVIGYLHYEWVHFAVHYTQPKTRLLQWMVRTHYLHHNGFPDANFGFVLPLWDRVFGTNRS